MKKRWLSGILAVMLVFSGCTYGGGNVDGLLRPPRLSDEQNDIWLALKKDSQGDSIKLVYPQRGENRSAILLTNLDDEPGDEAVVFFQPATASSAAAPIRMKVLDKLDGEWESMYDLVLDGTQIEDVSILNVGTGVPLLAIGLNFVGDGSHLLRVMQFDGKILNTVFSQNYQAKGFYDLDGDGKDDIFLVENPESEVKTWAKLYSYENGRFLTSGSALVNPEITRYTNILKGYMAQGEEAVYLDGYKGSELMTTEILSFDRDKGQLINWTYDGQVPKKYPVDRVPLATCYDLSNDGVIEVPGIRPLPGYAESSTSPLYLTDWYHFADGQYERIQSSFVNSPLGYMLTFPENWIGKVSAQKTTQENEVLFYEYHMGQDPLSSALLYLKVATRSEWVSEKVSNDYELIDTRGQIVYLAKIPDSDSALKISIPQVKEYFSRII